MDQKSSGIIIHLVTEKKPLQQPDNRKKLLNYLSAFLTLHHKREICNLVKRNKL